MWTMSPPRLVLTRIGVIGDVQADVTNLRIALSLMQSHGLTTILCVGDVVDDGIGDVDACCELLRTNGVHTVRGNRDRWFSSNQARTLPEATQPEDVSLSALTFLSSLPDVLEFDTVAGKLLLCHGIGTNDMRQLSPDDF